MMIIIIIIIIILYLGRDRAGTRTVAVGTGQRWGE